MKYGRKPKRVYRRRKTNTRRYTRPNRPIKTVSPIHYFKRTKVDTFDIALTVGAGEKFGALYSDVSRTVYNDFQLLDIPNYTEFTALYDSYKICGIKQKFVFLSNSGEVGNSAIVAESIPMLITVNDFNTPTALANEATALQYASYKIHRLDKPCTRYFRPCQEIENNLGAVVKSRWNPTSEDGIEHHGLLTAWTSYSIHGDARTTGILKVYTTYYLAMRTPK